MEAYSAGNLIPATFTLLHRYAESGDLKGIQKELQGAQQNPSTLLQENGFGYTALEISASKGRDRAVVHICEAYKKCGYPLDPPLPKMTHIHLAALVGHRWICERLLQYGVGVNLTDDHGRGPAHYAALNNRVTVLEKLGTDPGFNVSLTDLLGDTPLHYAAKEGHLESCVWLLANGALPYATNREGQDPLAVARISDRVDEVFENTLGIAINTWSASQQKR